MSNNFQDGSIFSIARVIFNFLPRPSKAQPCQDKHKLTKSIYWFGVKLKPHIYAPILTLLSITSQIFWLTLEISGQNDRIRSEVWPLSYPKDTIFVRKQNFGALGRTVEVLTIPRETVDIEEFSPISYENKFIKYMHF